MSEPITVKWLSSEEYIATTATFPSLSWIDTTAEAAKAGMELMIAEAIIDLTPAETHGHNAVNSIDADIAVTLTPAEAAGINIAARLPDHVRAQLLAWIDGQDKPNPG